ncbi:hypothetical protein KAFR_0H01740 [Kazachstania africana CBS 2517]|uniref:Ribosome assembly protein 3 n=1 Tax=Kazachstania africana (strain ATCC 22294 / BCRC 22015 / CBS 2517 / CECT 1963 / NBRC 1671 / NRRL Y-8276) TaxID=1071382 RepID=H2AZ28_KAZAF|nr:hypothetical protein KAFR_0H01740 [Kazachstania africana CBS 2517]CCF59584.1 hypothetical protein KAFR_0H01740 [Kazachstania africana CBS 2517]
MSAADISVVKSNSNKKSRRRKKRRTADVSDSSSSDSSSSSDNEVVMDEEIQKEDKEIEVSDVELSDKEKESVLKEELDDTTKDKLSNISFTKTELITQNKNIGRDNFDFKKISATLEDGKQKLFEREETNKKLKNDYLGLLFESYGDDINAVRESSDFTNKSLVLLANVLKEGSNMFDTDTLKTILEKK